MLETMDLEASLNEREYENAAGILRRELGLLQRELWEASIPVLVIVEGWEASGKGFVLNEMIRPLDPRGFIVKDEAEPDPAAPLYPFFLEVLENGPGKGKDRFPEPKLVSGTFQRKSLPGYKGKGTFFQEDLEFRGKFDC